MGKIFRHLLLALMAVVFCALPGLASADSQIVRGSVSLSEMINNSQTAKTTDQIILVTGHHLSLWEKQNGFFTETLSSFCGYGRNGLRDADLRHEGDGTTPIGVFDIPYAFGIKANPGTTLEYKNVTESSYHSGEPADYNQWVEVTPGTRDMSNSEHMMDYQPMYDYGMMIGFNYPKAKLGNGASIFLHVKNPAHSYTAGCVSVPEDIMVALLQKCRPGTKIIIVKSDKDVANY